MFSPTEKLETPLAIDLIFMQIVRDFTSTSCIRISETDRAKLSQFLGKYERLQINDYFNFWQLMNDYSDSRGMSTSFVNSQPNNFKMALKKQIIEIAKEWPLYFCRLFPVAVIFFIFLIHDIIISMFRSTNCLVLNISKGCKQHASIQMLGISHSGVRLIKRERDQRHDVLIPIEFYKWVK